MLTNVGVGGGMDHTWDVLNNDVLEGTRDREGDSAVHSLEWLRVVILHFHSLLRLIHSAVRALTIPYARAESAGNVLGDGGHSQYH